MKKNFNKKGFTPKKSGFTLIELLVVVGILGLLAVAALVAINPAEAQRKSRDSQRLKDMATLQTVVEQFLSDNSSPLTLTSGTSETGDRDCATGWLADALGGSTCAYISTLPIDPVNRVASVWSSGGARVTKGAYYFIKFGGGGTYKICTYLESAANESKLTVDGGKDDERFEAFSDVDVACE